MAGGRFKKLKGDLFMGYRAVIAHPLRMLFDARGTTGLERFIENYGSEGLVPMTASDREILSGAARCIHCGLCDAYDQALSTLPRTAYDGASLLAISYSRATPDIPRAREAISRLTDSLLVKAEAVCPTRVPLRAIAAYLREKLVLVLQTPKAG